MTGSLKGKVGVVYGGGGHICSSLVAGFIDAGCASVFCCDMRLEKAEAVADVINDRCSINGMQGSVIPLQADACSKLEHEKVLEVVLKTSGSLDFVVNGAGINSAVPFFEIDFDEWNRVVNSHLTATFFSCQVYGSYFVKRGGGVFLNISSASADPPLSRAFPYSAAKAAVANLTKNLAREWGKSGIRVNALRPGFFPTEWNRKNFIDEERAHAILKHTPMKRFGDPSELVSGAVWICSDDAGFVTGTELVIDGGFSCQTI